MQRQSGMKKRKDRSSQSDHPDEVVGDDRLSSLPDDLIGRILSFLPTWQAALTTQLSRRWRRVWPAHVSALNLSVRDLARRGRGRRRFVALAREALLRFPTPGIPSISVEIDHHTDIDDGWYSQAMERAVGSVRVTSLRGLMGGLELPPCARAEALAVTSPRNILTLPPDDLLVLGRLAELSLSLVQLGARPLDEFLSSCCPRLRRLRLRAVRGHAVRLLALHTLDLLEVLDINSVDDLATLDVSAANLRCLNVRSCFRGGSGGEVVVSAPRIETVGWYRSYPKHLTFRSGLTHVRRLAGPLKLPALGRRDQFDAPYTMQLLQSCSLVVGHLDLELVMPDEMALVNWLGTEPEAAGAAACEDLIRHVPELPRVSVLSLNIRWGFAGGSSIAPSLASLLSRTPSLTRLHIRASPYCFSVFEGQEEEAAPARGSWHECSAVDGHTDGDDRRRRLGRRLDCLREVSVDGLSGADREEHRVIELLFTTIVPPSLERMSLAFLDHAAASIVDEIAREIPTHFPMMATGRWERCPPSVLTWIKLGTVS